MVLYYTVTINDRSFRKMMDKFQSPLVMKEVTEANYKTGKILADTMFKYWVAGDVNSERRKHQREFRAIKNKGSYVVDVTVPMQAYWMDKLRYPRYFKINNKLRMKRWINKNFGSIIYAGREHSKFHREKGGRLVGHLYVHPYPFSRRALQRIREVHKGYLGKVVKNVIKGGV